MKPKKPRTNIPCLLAIAALALTAGSAHAAITLLGNSTAYTSGAGSGGVPHTLSYNPGATSTAIVLALAMETGSGTPAVTFGGVPMVPVVAYDSSNVGIYYLNNPTVGAASDLTVNCTSIGTVNFIAFQVFSLNASDMIEATNTVTAGRASVSTTSSVVLNVPSSGSFVMAGLNFNEGSSGVTVNAGSPLTETFGSFINSGGASFGYVNNVASGDQTYSFSVTGGNGTQVMRRTTVTSFNVVPEPSAALLLSLGTLGILIRRRR